MRSLRLLPFIFLFLVSCETPDAEEKRQEELSELEKKLEREVSPVVTRLITAYSELDVDTIYDNCTDHLLSTYNRDGLRNYLEKNKATYERLSKSAKVKSIKRYGSLYAVAEINTYEGPQFWAFIEEDDDWKLHQVSDNFYYLISYLQ